MKFYGAIRETWTRKNITQKMHYSEPTAVALTPMQRRKHSPRVATLPPCADDMDLMIEAKDKEQAVFELMRAFKLPGFDTFNNIIPHVRTDESKAGVKGKVEGFVVAEEDRGMGGPEGRVYWPPGMEHWLRPKKREPKVKDEEKVPASAGAKSARGKRKSAVAVEAMEEEVVSKPVPRTRKRQTKTVDYAESGQSD
jgi:UV DNA damage endonuclease